MNANSHPKGPIALDFKSATLYAVRVVLRTSDTQALLEALHQRMHDAGSFFQDEPVVIDATQLDATQQSIDWESLIAALRSHQLHPVGVCIQAEHLDQAIASGLPNVELSNPPSRPLSEPAPEQEVPVITAAVSLENPSTEDSAATTRTVEVPAPAAMTITRQLRSGQRIYARNTDLIIVGAVSQGAEVIADGNIHVYGPLRGKAMAGARGDANARIYTTELDPELIAIAGVYRIMETRLDPSLRNKSAVISLNDEKLEIQPLTS
ncbi:septum site-determining protein MinC [Alcaligenes endophyticus]|uniref:Probable septum site-determining protein MinC n=1 Tax=Alcaligenes endophyticus TaxID=1929088 RepID=A0ABT8EH52_9BURK|nr:septum site-determining protein MinC [Alcaligenes endophyticus]MCX5589744.1 septum site-determining protein MinC [Alcaligenes endophyticus]MDN4120592.1 septum site-determining protein MinC [Alcaligenes endophyticus]